MPQFRSGGNSGVLERVRDLCNSCKFQWPEPESLPESKFQTNFGRWQQECHFYINILDSQMPHQSHPRLIRTAQWYSVQFQHKTLKGKQIQNFESQQKLQEIQSVLEGLTPAPLTLFPLVNTPTVLRVQPDLQEVEGQDHSQWITWSMTAPSPWIMHSHQLWERCVH